MKAPTTRPSVQVALVAPYPPHPDDPDATNTANPAAGEGLSRFGVSGSDRPRREARRNHCYDRTLKGMDAAQPAHAVGRG